MSDDEKIGEIRVEEHYEPFKGHKYIVYIRLPTKVDADKLFEVMNVAFEQHSWIPTSIEVSEDDQPFPREFEIFWQAYAEVEKKEIPRYKYTLYLLANEPAHSIEDVEVPVAEALESEGFVPENQGSMHVKGKRVKLFPYERPRVVNRIPLTRGMLRQALEKKRKEQMQEAGRKKDAV